MREVVYVSAEKWDDPLHLQIAQEMIDESENKGIFNADDLAALMRSWIIGTDDRIDDEPTDEKIDAFHRYLHVMTLYRLHSAILDVILDGEYICSGLDQNGEPNMVKVEIVD